MLDVALLRFGEVVTYAQYAKSKKFILHKISISTILILSSISPDAWSIAPNFSATIVHLFTFHLTRSFDLNLINKNENGAWIVSKVYNRFVLYRFSILPKIIREYLLAQFCFSFPKEKSLFKHYRFSRFYEGEKFTTECY